MTDQRKTVLITGCNAPGIGNALAREFHSRGLRVFATARKASAIADLEALGIETLSLEITNDTSIIAVRETIALRCDGKLDYLVNNAGRNYTVPAVDMDMSEVKAMFDVNVFGVMRMCQVFAPLVIEAKGTIVQLGSLAGIMPYVFGSSYNASKAALHSYSDTLRVELKPFGVNVLTVVTGGVKSNIARTERSLPRDSIYLPIEENYNRRQKHSQEVGMLTSQYASNVVGKVLGRQGVSGRRIWEGNFAKVVWFANSFLPHSVLVSLFIDAVKPLLIRISGICYC